MSPRLRVVVFCCFFFGGGSGGGGGEGFVAFQVNWGTGAFSIYQRRSTTCFLQFPCFFNSLPVVFFPLHPPFLSTYLVGHYLLVVFFSAQYQRICLIDFFTVGLSSNGVVDKLVFLSKSTAHLWDFDFRHKTTTRIWSDEFRAVCSQHPRVYMSNRAAKLKLRQRFHPSEHIANKGPTNQSWYEEQNKRFLFIKNESVCPQVDRGNVFF